MKQIAIVAFIVLFGTLTSSSVTAQPPKSPVTPTSQALTPEVTGDARTLALQAEVQVLKEFTQHILSTVYFALGTVVVVLVAMSGFGWYQSARVYERDKEALSQWVAKHLGEQVDVRATQLDDQMKGRFLSFDHKIAEALKHTFQKVVDLQVHLETELFSKTHFEPTPETDLHVLMHMIRRLQSQITPETLGHTLTIITEHLESLSRINSLLRTELLTMANALPEMQESHAVRIREILSSKPQ